jgi:CHASE2 domain-containing sensor protein
MRKMKVGFFLNITGLVLLLCLLSSASLGASFRDDFAVVFIDAASEAKYGAFPFDRSLIAAAIRQAGNLGAKGVVLKFFFDQAKGEAGDALLAAALTNLPVVLQARIDDTEVHPNSLPDRFTLPEVKEPTSISGRSGWIPISRFMANARGVGFVDFASTRVPMLETYQSRTVKSLVVCCIELATEKSAVFGPDGSMRFGTNEFRLDGRSCVTARMPAKDDLAYIPFTQFLVGDTPANQIKGKVVIIGYDGPGIQSFETAIGPVKAHRLFVYDLESIYEQIGN